MRRHLIPFAFLLLLSCSEDASKLNSEERTHVAKTGREATAQLMKALKNELVNTIRDTGIVTAISVCNSSAPQLAKSIARDSEHVIEISRTSRRTRNKLNNPDNLDLRALQFFEEKVMTPTDSLPAFFVTRDGELYRYYEPIFIQPLCLNCHGTQETIPETLRLEIRKYYPADQAVGYALGDLRGVFRVRIAGK